MVAGNRHKTVFIGNLAHEGSEDELRSIFAQMGPVSTLRVVVDRDTGMRKGFAFLEYFDPETAQLAVRQLNGMDFYGRTLRVSIAEQDTKHSTDGPTYGTKKRKPGAAAGPPGSDRVAAVIAGTASAQLFDVLQEAKAMAAHQPHDLLAVLHSQPHLLRALHLSLDRLNPPPAPYEAPPGYGDAVDWTSTARPAVPAAPRYDHAPGRPYEPQPGASLPPINQTGHAPPPFQPPPQPLGMGGGGMADDRGAAQSALTAEMLQQVMSLTPEQLQALPEHERAQMMALQDELRRGGHMI